MSDIHNVAVLGGGVIGASWTALFLAAGRKVTVYDPAPDTEQTVRAYIASAGSALEELGLADRATPDALTFVGTATQAVKDADFCLLYTSPSPRDKRQSRMPSSA